MSGTAFVRSPTIYKTTSTDKEQGRNTWTCVQLILIDLLEVLIGLEEECE